MGSSAQNDDGFYRYIGKEIRNLSTFTLKLIAIIIMLIDHIGAILIPEHTDIYLLFRSIGRLAFPLFCFLLVEGLHHTRSVKKYLLRLGIFALISEFPYDLAFADNIRTGFLQQQNVFFTLFIGLLVIYLMGLVERKIENNPLIVGLIQSSIVIIGCAVAILLHTDYTFMGILLIVAFNLFRGKKVLLAISLFLITNYTGYNLEGLATLSIIFILFYNGKKGPKGNKYFFYVFYPAHILLLYFISLLPVFR